MILTQRDMNIAALTMWAEARSEPEEGQAAVAWVILHRTANPRWWGRGGVAEICLRDRQFSCWNDDDPQRARMLAMLVGGDTEAGVMTLEGFEATKRQRDILRRVLAGAIPDPTDGATHYLTHAAARTARWARDRMPRVIIGGHRFFAPQDIGEAPITPWRPVSIPVADAEPAPALSGGLLAAIWRIVAAIFGGQRNA